MSVPGETAPPASVVVVGAGLGGWRTASELRVAGYRGLLTVVGDEPVPPYDRPPLSKAMLDKDGDPELPTLASAAEIASSGIELLLGVPAARVVPGLVALADGTELRADAIVVATGSRARWPNRLPRVDRVPTLRTHADALAVRDALSAAGSLTVLGGGFIGAEVATAAAERGLDVHLIEGQPELFAAALGKEVGAALRHRHEERGVRVRTGRSVVGLVAAEELTAVLDDGTTVTSAAGVAGFGAVLNTAALVDLQEGVAQGVRCDVVGRVEGAIGVWAVGDVAAWWDPVLGRHARREHWAAASEHAAIVASDVIGSPRDRTATQVPYFWSDQAGTKLQVVGWPELADAGEWVEESVYCYRRSGVLVAAAAIGAPRVLARIRKTMSETASTSELMRGSSR